MNNIIINILIVYWLVATFILLNLLFNYRFRLVWKDEKTGNVTRPPYWVFIIVCLQWLPIAIVAIMKNIKGGKTNE